MGLLKALGGFASSYGPALTEMGKVRTSKELVQKEMDWVDLKASKLAEAKVSSEKVSARRKATELVLKEVGDQITTIENSLGGQQGMMLDQGMRKIQMDRLSQLTNIRNELSRAHLVDVGWNDEYIIKVLFPGRKKKKNGDDDGGDKKKVVDAVGTITKTDKGSGGEGKGWGLGVGFPGKIHFIGEAIRNIAWENDILVNAIKEVGAFGAEDSFIRQAIATVLGREPSILNAESEADINNIVSDPVTLKTIVGNILNFIADPLNRTVRPAAEWSGEGPAPGEDANLMDQQLIDGEGYERIQDASTTIRDTGPDIVETDYIPGGGDVGDEMPGTALGTTRTGMITQGEKEYEDYAPTTAEIPPPTMLPAEKGTLYPPGPIEPMSYNHVEGKETGSVNLISMRIGDIAKMYGYTTPIGLGFTYNQLIEIARKYIYPGSSKKEVIEILDNINFTEKVQNIFMKHKMEGE